MIVFVVLWCLDVLGGWVWLLYVRMSLLACLCVICCSVRDVVCVTVLWALRFGVCWLLLYDCSGGCCVWWLCLFRHGCLGVA